MEKFEKHPAYEDNFEGNPETPEELEEAKKMAGVTTHKEVLERAKELGLEEGDQFLVENAEREIQVIEEEMKAKENLLSASAMLEKLTSYIQKQERLKEEISDIDNQVKQLQELSQKMADMTFDTGQVMEKISLSEDKKGQLEGLFNELKSALPYDREDIDFAMYYLNELKKFQEKLNQVSDEEKQKLLKKIPEKTELPDYTEKITEIWKKKAKKREHVKIYDGAAKAYEHLGDIIKAKEMWRKEAGKCRFKYEAYGDAAKAYEKLGDTEKAKEMWRKEAKKREAEDSYSWAAEAYEKLGDTEKATEMWKKDKEMRIKSAGKYESEGKYGAAAEAYEKLDYTEKAKEMWKKWAEKCESEDNYYDAAIACEKLGDTVKAKDLWIKSAEECESKGKYNWAAKNYEKLGDTEKATEMWKKEAKRCEAKDSYSWAAKAYEHLGDIIKATEMWEKWAKQCESSGIYDWAIEGYEKIPQLTSKQRIQELLDKIKEL